MPDFTLKTYRELLFALKEKNYVFVKFEDYVKSGKLDSGQAGMTRQSRAGIAIIRHDVDRKPLNSLEIAKLERSLEIKGTYYFRIVPESYDLQIMEKISKMGHEIGYHYEDVDLVNVDCRMKNVELYKNNKDGYRDVLIDMAYESFCKNLEMMRRNCDIKTICMHGSPSAKYDNKIIWEKHDYKKLGILGEPYLDIDWNEFGYFTDTGRRWNGNNVNVRDRVNAKYNFNLKTTHQLINNLYKLPDKIMFTIHP